MQAFYGYDDASGAYFVIIDTDKCRQFGQRGNQKGGTLR